jgi:DNA adenine methylase
MALILDRIRAQFILSINDHSEMRAIFLRFCIDTVRLKYTVEKYNSKVGKELLATNV